MALPDNSDAQRIYPRNMAMAAEIERPSMRTQVAVFQER